MKKKSLIIIGGGIAGLSAGCFAQKNGFDTSIFEQHSKTGGWCTHWKRKDYYIDGCLHHFAGMADFSPFSNLYRQLGILPVKERIYRDHLVQIEDENGKKVVFYSDPDRLKSHLLEIAPEDKKWILKYINAIKKLEHFELLSLSFNKHPLLAMLPRLPFIMKWVGITLEQYASKFTNPFLKRAFPHAQYDFEEVPMLIHLNFMAGIRVDNFGWIKGGSYSIAKNVEKRFLELGGMLHVKQKVKKIIVEDNKVKGIELEDGTKEFADVVIGACDGYSIIYKMLGGKYKNELIDKYYADTPDSQDMNFHISLGINRDFKDEPAALTFFLKNPMTILGKERDHLNLEIYNFDSSFAPKGKTVIKILMDASYIEWKELSKDRNKYLAAKDNVAQLAITCLEERFPGIRNVIEMIDIATPVTIERYTGSRYGTQAEPPKGKEFSIIKGGWCQMLPGLKDLYLCGQWAGGIGISTGIVSGMKIVERICRDKKIKFQRQNES